MLQCRAYDINRLKEFLGPDVCSHSHLLFIHGVTGCDLTCRIFSVGKRLFSINFRKVTRLCPSVLCQPIHPTEPDNGCY